MLEFGFKDKEADIDDAEWSEADQDFPKFDAYRVIEKIGEGGCGMVYRAEQIQPVRREVAIKVIKLGMDTRAVTVRFEVERQALAMMDHPGIAKVFDAGVSKEGRPYFVMELVRGERITEYCEKHQLSLQERVEMFIKLCQAVQHAHQKGVIHRDIKPSNVLVMEHEGMAVPKVIDFGVAKATTRQRLADQTIYTVFDQFVGTPAYMSPEQAGLTGEDVDTRSDIYSLGVLLYELLTGKPPFDPERLKRAALDEVCRIIREEEPLPPSTRVKGEKGSGKPGIEQGSASSRRRLQLTKGDLDWIVLKALEKDRARRYDTANDLGQDLLRHLNHEPVAARPPTAGYRLQKTIQRNRLAFASGSLIFLTLLAAAMVSIWRYGKEKEARVQALAAESKASLHAARSDEVANLLKEMLASAGPSVALGRDATMLKELLDKTALRLDSERKVHPEVEAELREIVGRTYADLHELDKAAAQHRLALRLRETIFGPVHAAVNTTLGDLVSVLNMRARAEDLREAESLARRSLELSHELFGTNSVNAAGASELLAWNLRSQDQRSEAEKLMFSALAIRRRVVGSEDASLISILNSLSALIASDQKRLGEAEALAREALRLQTKHQGAENQQTANTLHALASVLWNQKKLPEAESAVRQVLTIRRKLLGHENSQIPTTLSLLADILSDQNRLEEAEAVIREALALQRKYYGLDHPHIPHYLLPSLTRILHNQRKWKEAEFVGRESVELCRAAGLGEQLIHSINLLAMAYTAQHKWAEAEHCLRECLELCEKSGDDNWFIKSTGHCFNMRRALGEALLKQGKLEEAEVMLLAANAGLHGRTGKWEVIDFRRSMEELVETYEALNKKPAVLEWRGKLEGFNRTNNAAQ